MASVSMRCSKSFDRRCCSRFEHVITNDNARVRATDRTNESEKGLHNTARGGSIRTLIDRMVRRSKETMSRPCFIAEHNAENKSSDMLDFIF